MKIRQQLEHLINSLHREISENIELSDDTLVSKESIRDQIRAVLAERELILSKQDVRDVFQALISRMIGYGPIQPFLEDPEVNEIMVNNPIEIFVERDGNLYPAEVSFRDGDHIRAVIERMIAPVGRRIDESSPYVDARLPDGSRINAVIPPLAIRGPSLTIRKFASQPFTIDRLIELDTLNLAMARFLKIGIEKKLNMIVSGGTGSGKTSTLNALIREIPPQERLVVIEDTAELQVVSRNYVSLESRPPNVEGKGEVTIQHLVRNALRMRPDRIIVGEVRGPEAFDMLQAMNTGHPGSFTTVHANSPIDAVRRVESMVLTAGLELPQAIIREQLASAVDLILQQERLSGGARKVISISEIVSSNGKGKTSGEITVREIFRFQEDAVGGVPPGQGRHVYTGCRPECFQNDGRLL